MNDELSLIKLIARLDDEGRQALEIALGEALRIGRFWLGVEFLLIALSKQDKRPLSDLLHESRVSRGHFRGVLREMVGVVTKDDWRRVDVAKLGVQAFDRLKPADPETLAASFSENMGHPPVVTPRMMEVLRHAAKTAGEGQISHSHLLLAALKHPQSIPVNLLVGQAVQAGRDPREVLAWVAQQAGLESPDLDQEIEVLPTRPQAPPVRRTGMLKRFGRDLTDLAQRGELRPAVGESAHRAMVQIGLILQQTQANNPIVLGDPGVGKTAIVEGFAWWLAVGAEHDHPVAPQLAGRRIVELEPTTLLAGTRYKGDLEERLQGLLNEVRKAAGGTIVFIDGIHTIVGIKAGGSLGTIAEALKPVLGRGEFPCIGATTISEYHRYIEADPVLARRFTPVWIEEPAVEESIEIVTQVTQERLGPYHSVSIHHEAVEEAVLLSARYLHDERLPGKAIKLLDQAALRVVMGGSLGGMEEVDRVQPVGGEVTAEIVREIVSACTGIPLTRLSEDESQRLLQLEDSLKRRVIGQDKAVKQVAQIVRRARVGLSDPLRPLGVFLFAGPTGVGKTELSLALAEALFGEEDAILRLDMSEYGERHQVWRLVGSPPGYVGHEEKGQLTGRLRRRPYSVVLLDEVEKAHEGVQHLLLQLFDAGQLTDAQGNLADGRNAIFIMTTMLGAKVPLGLIQPQMSSFLAKMRAAIGNHFRPEFLDRIDRIIYFEPLDEDTLLAIFDRQFEAMAARLRQKGIEVEVTEGFKRALCKRHTDVTRGARPLRRAIENEIVAPLAGRLLDGEIKPGMKIVVGEGSEMDVSESPALGGVERSVSEPQLPDFADPDARDELKAQNEAVFEREFEALETRLHERGIKVELDGAARDLLCDPFWTETTLKQALARLVEEPLTQQLEAGEFQAGDRVRIERYADHLEFKKVEGEDQ